jgi:hypothetical protein
VFLLGLLSMAPSAHAAPWHNHLTLPSGDEVQLRTEGRRVQPAGSRGEIDLPVRVRFATPVDSPAGSVVMADAKVRLICKDGTVSATAIKPRDANQKLVATKEGKTAANATRAALMQVLAAQAVIDSLCRR